MLTLLAMKQLNGLSPKTIDCLMRLVLLGPKEFENKIWKELVDRYKAAK